MEKKKKNDQQYSERPAAEYWDPHLCPVCGNNDYVWGRIVDDAPMTQTYFREDGSVLGSGRKMKARQCTRCGNVQLFAERD